MSFEENPALIEAVIVLIKKIFCIERTIEKDRQTGKSAELN